MGATRVSDGLGRLAFLAAVGWLLVAAGIGLLLRAAPFLPGTAFAYGHLLHAHSHVAFLGWVFSAFFGLGLRGFVPVDQWRGYRTLFFWGQASTLAMAVAFPLQGYARESIIASSVHLCVALRFVWRLWRGAPAGGAGRLYLGLSFLFLALSALGPLALGPLAAGGLRGSPWYTFSIYVYLHFHYNGFFVFFLIALLLSLRGLDPALPRGAARAAPWLAAGTVLTLAQSALWLQPPAWVWALAALGGALLTVGTVRVLARLARGGIADGGRVSGGLLALAGACLLLKVGLQCAAAWPALQDLVSHRWVAVAFLHLVFLGVVTPVLWVLGERAGWFTWHGTARAGLAAFLAGVVATQLVLAAVPLAARLGLPSLPAPAFLLLAGSALLFLGLVAVASGARRRGLLSRSSPAGSAPRR
jgi:hypothetical protein